MIHIGLNHSKSHFKLPLDADQIQPNACDLRLYKVFEILDDTFVLTDTTKTHRRTVQIFPQDDGYFHFEAGKCYDVVMQEEVEIADGEAGWLVTRSTLNRNGLFITSGLYDSGFKGFAAGILHVEGGPAKIFPGTRVAQFVLFEAKTAHQYNGDYGKNKDGSVKEMERSLGRN